MFLFPARSYRTPFKGLSSCEESGEVLSLSQDGKGTHEHRILIVDDNEIVSDMMKQMLRRMGYLSVMCNKPTDALSLFSRAPERFDAVIVDEDCPT